VRLTNERSRLGGINVREPLVRNKFCEPQCAGLRFADINADKMSALISKMQRITTGQRFGAAVQSFFQSADDC